MSDAERQEEAMPIDMAVTEQPVEPSSPMEDALSFPGHEPSSKPPEVVANLILMTPSSLCLPLNPRLSLEQQGIALHPVSHSVEPKGPEPEPPPERSPLPLPQAQPPSTVSGVNFKQALGVTADAFESDENAVWTEDSDPQKDAEDLLPVMADAIEPINSIAVMTTEPPALPEPVQPSEDLAQKLQEQLSQALQSPISPNTKFSGPAMPKKAFRPTRQPGQINKAPTPTERFNGQMERETNARLNRLVDQYFKQSGEDS